MNSKRRFSFKRLALVASLALTGLFGFSSFVINKSANDNSVVEEAKADNEIEYNTHGHPSTIYLKIGKETGRWNDGIFQKDYIGSSVMLVNCKFYDSTGSTAYSGGASYTLVDVHFDNSYWIGKVSIPDADGVDKIEFNNGDQGSWGSGAWTKKYDLPTRGGTQDGKNMFIVTTNSNSPQTCTYAYYKREYTFQGDSHGNSGVLYFIPSKRWRDGNYSSKTLYPYIYCQWKENGETRQNAPWPGQCFSNVSSAKSSDNNVFMFSGIPYVQMTQITIVFNNDLILSDSNSPRINFNEYSRNNWWDGTGQKANVFGMYTYDWYNNVGENQVDIISGNYSWSTSETLLAGSFLEHDYINWYGWPMINNTFQETATSFYSIKLNLTIGDEFQLVFYNKLTNSSYTDQQSRWKLYGQSADGDDEGGRDWNGYNDMTITVYDDCVSKTTPIGSGLVSNYISQADGKYDNVKINHAGTVTISNTANRQKSGDKAVITMRWHDNSTRTFMPSSTLPDNVYGSFNLNDHTYHPIEWNPSTGRYEALCGILAGDTFRMANGSTGINISTLTLWNSEDISVSSTTPGTNNITVNTNTDFYCIGWYYANINPDGEPQALLTYFIDRTHSFTASRKLEPECGEAFALRVLATPTCTCNTTTFNAINTLLSKCTYDTTGAFLSNYSYYDYDYDSYVAAGGDYSSTQKSTTHKTNMAFKYQWLDWNSRSRPDPRPTPGLGNFGNLLSGEENGSLELVIIIASSLSLLSITALSILLLKRKKKEKTN